MNGKEIFLGLQYLGDDLIMEAEKKGFPKRKGIFRRPLLLAAVIALMLLLVGCAVVYVLNIQSLKLGDRLVTEEWWDAEQKTMVTETVSQQVLTFSGLKGSPNYEAAKEWYEFRKDYDPDWNIYHEYRDAGKQYRGTPEYSLYNIYTLEMKAKIDEIMKKYGLKLKGAPVDAFNGKQLLAYLGMDGILLPDANASGNDFNVFYHDGGWFHTYMDMQLEDHPEWPYQFLLSLYYSPKDCFDNTICELNDASDWEEWNYTTASGETVLVIRSPSVWVSWVFYDRGDATITLRMETILERYSDDYVERIVMPDDTLKQVLDCIDFSIHPQPGAPALLEGPPASRELSQNQNGYTVTVKDVFTDGLTAKVVLGIAGPEDVNLEKDDRGFLFFSDAALSPQNEANALAKGRGHGTKQDHDGKANTIDYTVETFYDLEEGIVFHKGGLCRLSLQDLCVNSWNEKLSQWETQWEVAGDWNFEITLDQGDWREIEFVGEPITTSACIGWDMDGSDVFEDVTITSLKLRSFGGKVISTWEGGQLDFANVREEKFPVVMLQDGKTIQLDGMLGIYNSARDGDRIPLDEVDYLLLMDGTRLDPIWEN